MVYNNLTNLTEYSWNFYDVVFNLNELSNGYFFSFLLLSLFVGILLLFPNQDFSKLLVLDGFFVSFIAFLGFILGFIGWGLLVLPLLVFMGSIIFYKLHN